MLEHELLAYDSLSIEVENEHHLLWWASLIRTEQGLAIAEGVHPNTPTAIYNFMVGTDVMTAQPRFTEFVAWNKKHITQQTVRSLKTLLHEES